MDSGTKRQYGEILYLTFKTTAFIDDLVRISSNSKIKICKDALKMLVTGVNCSVTINRVKNEICWNLQINMFS